jgi:flagella basal body P-ring formation protein FlgA
LSFSLRAPALSLVLLLVPPLVGARACASSIELLPEATIDGASVTLGEIAHVQGRGSADTAALAALSLGPAPHIGLERRVRRDDVVRALRARGWDETDSVTYSGALVTTIHVASKNVPADALVRCAGDALSAALAARYRDVKLSPIDAPVTLALPVAQIDYRARPPLLPKPLAHRVPQWVDVYADGRLYRSIPVTFDVSAHIEVLAAGRDLQQDASLGASGVAWREVDAARVDAQPLPPEALSDGLTMRHAVQAGAPLTWRDVAVRPAVAHGDWVVLRAGAGAVHIEERARALEDGQPGARVHVKVASGVELSARVVGSGVVEADGS